MGPTSDQSYMIQRRKTYDVRYLELAVEAVENGICSSRKAAKYYGVPRSSVVSRIYRKKPRAIPPQIIVENVEMDTKSYQS